MELTTWQGELVVAVKAKYPMGFTPEQRLLAIFRQVADVSQTLQFGEIGNCSLQTRIAAILPDVFLLFDQCGVDLEKELQYILDWFKSNGKRCAEM